MEIKNFAILNGKYASENDGKITLNFKGKPKNIARDKITPEDFSFAEIRSDHFFSNGELELKFKRTSYASGVLFVFPIGNDEYITAGMSYYEKAFIISNGIRNKESLDSAGNTELYELGKEHSLKITVYGSKLKVYVNKILLCEATVAIKEGPIMIRAVSEKDLEIYDLKLKAVKPQVFVIMQFTKEYNEPYEDVIKPVVENRGYECIRADEFYTSTPILKDIIDSIKQSSIIIAEITPDNPNVFYEIGYSHAIEKPTILLCDRKREKLPFDLSSFRTLFYENTIAGKKKIEDNLKKYLDNLI